MRVRDKKLRWEAPPGKWVMIASRTMPTREQPNTSAPSKSGKLFRNWLRFPRCTTMCSMVFLM